MPELAVAVSTTTPVMQQGGRLQSGTARAPEHHNAHPGRVLPLGSPAGPSAAPERGPVHRSGCYSPLTTSGSALLEEIDELPRRRSSYIATIPWSAMRRCGGGCTMNYNTISAQRIAGALGAEIAGVDLSRPLSDEVIGEIRKALLDHQVIFFHDQHLTPEQHLAFGRRFGELQIHDFVEPAEEDQHILEVRKELYETRNFGGGWHTDVSYLERPSLGSVLYAREVPEFGGDTLFANQYLAYESLSEGMKAMLDGMNAIHSACRPYGPNAARAHDYGPSSMRFV